MSGLAIINYVNKGQTKIRFLDVPDGNKTMAQTETFSTVPFLGKTFK